MKKGGYMMSGDKLKVHIYTFLLVVKKEAMLLK
jgi:hypothetical protein